jgi:hypothetical protein
MLTQDRLKEVLDYNPETGVFVSLETGDSIGCNDEGYVRITMKDRSKHYAHRLAWLYVHGKWPEGDIDHIDRNKSNNAISNLRDVPRAINIFNAPNRQDNTSGCTGVTWCKNKQKWKVRLRTKSLGYYTDFDAAVAARKQAESSDSEYLKATA